MIKAVIFDMDGLLIDSEPSWYIALAEFLRAKGFEYTAELSNKIRGGGHKESVRIFREEFGLEGNTEELIIEMRSYFYKVFLANPKLLEGAREIVGNLREKKFALALATGTGPRDKVLEILNVLKIKDYFELIITGDEIAKGKPNPDIYLLASERINIKPAECLVLEDTVNGTLSGKAAGMTVYGVNKDKTIKESLLKAGADKVFSSLLEIKDL
jgi:beta-phosphoglucomutase-like phosphatase (HAD superfamily)